MGDFIVHRARFFDYQPKAIQSMSYDEILKKLAISRSDSTIEIWCTTNEFMESIIVPTNDRQVEVVLWCRSQLLSAGLDGFIVLYDLARLTAKKLVPSIGGAIWCMTRNKSETKIAVGTEDGYVVLFDIQSDGLLFDKSLNKQDSRILSIAWHRDEEMLVTGGIDNIRVWDVDSGQVLQRIAFGRRDKNKETLVWCVAITSTFQIISGDSRGKVSVWNAENGSLVKSFQTHSVDVLCLCVDESEQHVYCSGIDPSIVQLDLVTTSEAEAFRTWTKSNVYYNHTHDVRSILVANEQLVSAGVDTKIVFKNIRDKHAHSLIRKYNSMPQKALVDACDEFVLLQYDKHLELWKMGETSEADAANLADKSNGQFLPVARPPRKLVHLNSRHDMHIVCSSLGSQHANNNNNNNNNKDSSHTRVLWLSYSDLNVIHIYRVEIASKHMLEPRIAIDKIKSLPLACGNRPAVLIKFVRQQLNDELRLCYLTNKSCMQCLKLVRDDGTGHAGFVLESSIQCIHQDLLLTDNRVYQMATRGDLVATADTDHNLTVWSLKSQQVVATLPRYERLTACMCFHPTQNYLLVCYANRKIVEYDLDAHEYTAWSRANSDKFPKQWLKSHAKLLSCFYLGANTNKIVTYDEQHLVLINKSERMPADPNAKIFEQQLAIQNSTSVRRHTTINHPHHQNGAANGGTHKNGDASEHMDTSSPSDNECALHISNKYRFIVYVNEPKDGQLLIFEVTPLSIVEKLPPSLKQKKFGT